MENRVENRLGEMENLLRTLGKSSNGTFETVPAKSIGWIKADAKTVPMRCNA
jgi:hypothetical protein